jgi:predicted short-subunit dehydrogenase-like oxidoreductase (DUF2520 family)
VKNIEHNKTKPMRIAIIGTGNVATVLGTKLLLAGNNIVQVWGRKPAETKHLAHQLDAAAVLNWKEIKPGADVYLIAIADNALATVHQHLQLTDELVVHTAGAVQKEVLKNISGNYGVLYPLQSLRKNNLAIKDIPFVIDGINQKSLQTIESLARSISKKVTVSDDLQRLRMHLAAVIVNNFVNNLYVLAEAYCKKYNLNFNHLLPLIQENIANLPNQSPQQLQTGPALRNDSATIAKHLELLQDDDGLRQIYQILTQSIQNVQQQNHSS